MKKITLFLITLLLTEVLSAQAFRNVNWGASMEEVKASEENKPDLSSEEILQYKALLAGMDVLLTYNFLPEHGLYFASYFFEEKHTNKNDFINDYKVIKSLLIEKYGNPILDKVIWENDLFKDKPQNYGTAVSAGHLKYYCKWTSGRTDIILALTGDNYEILMSLNYISLRLKSLAEEAIKKKNLKDF
jgi:hypothetical protein